MRRLRITAKERSSKVLFKEKGKESYKCFLDIRTIGTYRFVSGSGGGIKRTKWKGERERYDVKGKAKKV